MMQVEASGGGGQSLPIKPSYSVCSDGLLFINKCFRGKLTDARRLLLESSSILNYQNENGCTALHAASAAGQLEVVELLLSQKEINLTIMDDLDQNALFYAAYNGHLEVVQVFVEQFNMPLDMPDKVG